MEISIRTGDHKNTKIVSNRESCLRPQTLDRKQDDSPLIHQLPLRLEERELPVQPNGADDEISMCLGYPSINGNYSGVSSKIQWILIV